MNANWKNFLESRGAEFDEDRIVNVRLNDDKPADYGEGNFFCVISWFSIIKISGKDSHDFLHGQFTSELAAMGPGTVQISAWCNAKGQVIASFYIFTDTEHFYLLIPPSLKESFCKRLQMFILRADVSITDVSDEFVVFGLYGNSASVPVTDLAAREIPGKHNDRSLLFIPLSDAEGSWDELCIQYKPAGWMEWSRLDIQNGISWLDEKSTEQYLPQELNLDRINAVSFTKGCYPGQEIVARVHYRGKVKKQLYYLVADTDLPPGDDCSVCSASSEQVGYVLNHTTTGDGKLHLLVVAGTSLRDEESIYLNSTDGPMLTIQTLP